MTHVGGARKGRSIRGRTHQNYVESWLSQQLCFLPTNLATFLLHRYLSGFWGLGSGSRFQVGLGEIWFLNLGKMLKRWAKNCVKNLNERN